MRRQPIAIRILLVGTLTVGLSCGLFVWYELSPKQGTDLVYSDGVSFWAAYNTDFETVRWYCDDYNAPERCPLVISLGDRKLGAEYLSDFDRLEREGWSEFVSSAELTELYLGERLVRCWFHSKKLVHVEVNLTSIGGKNVSELKISVSGKTIKLPATETAIVSALGPPKERVPKEREW